MHNGWIKLHRKILYNPFFADSKKLKLWLICLLKASVNKWAEGGKLFYLIFTYYSSQFDKNIIISKV